MRNHGLHGVGRLSSACSWIRRQSLDSVGYRPVFLTKEQLMNSLRNKVWEFLAAEDGPTAVEYAVMLALIVMVCVVAIGSLGTVTRDQFVPVSNVLAP